MKKITFLILALAGGSGLMVWAQNNAPATKTKDGDAEAQITSGHGFYDGLKSQMTYSDHVQVIYPQIKLTCERLIIDIPRAGQEMNQPTNIVAESNVVVNYVEHGKPSLITADKAVYRYSVVNGVTNEPLTFTGHARYEDTNIIQTGEPIIYDCATHNVTIANPVTRPKHLPSSQSKTNGTPFNFLQ